MSRSALILATVHEFQGRGFEGYVEDGLYEDAIESCLRTGRIDFVFEEAAGRRPSIAEDYAKTLLGPGHYLDIDSRPNEMRKFGLPSERGLLLGPKPICGLPSWDVNRHKEREMRWLQKMNEQVFNQGLVICGVGHSLSFAFRLQNDGYSVELCQYLPYDRLCKREHAK